MGHQNFFFFCRYNGICNATRIAALEKYWGLRNLGKKHYYEAIWQIHIFKYYFIVKIYFHFLG